MNHAHKPTYSKSLFDIWLAIVTILYIVIFALTPMIFDDYTYTLGTASITSAAEKVSAIWEISKNHWYNDTGRLCNLLSPIFLGLLPKLVFSVISGGFILMSVMLMCRLAGVKRGSTGSWIIALLVTFTLPWFDYMFSVIFAINYVWPSALTLLIVYWLSDRDKVKSELSTVQFSGMCITALLAGWMHEGFSLPVIAGVLTLWVTRIQRPNKKNMILFAFYLVGTLLIIISPALWTRTANSESLFMRMSLMEQILHGIGFNVMFFIFCAFLIICSFKRSFRNILDENKKLKSITVFVASSSVVASLIFYLFYTGPRMGWYATQFCSIGIVALGHGLFPPVKRVTGYIINSLIATVIIANLTAAVVEQKKLYDENKEIVNLFLQSSDGEVYYDNISTHVSLSFMKSSMRNFNEYMPMALFSKYWREDENVMLSLLPSKLHNFTSDRVSACGSDSTLYLKDGLLLSRDSIPDNYSKILINTPQMGWIESRLRPRCFTAADGSRWILIVPHVTLMTGCRVTDAKWKENKK